jgi:cold shock CspA family protein/uncharacterized LabA/DUF88 family protein
VGKLTRIAVYYDGNFFSHISNYYAYEHKRRARIDIEGFHEFIRQRVAEEEQVDVRYAQVVDAHYFRGRRSAADANLYGERQFDTVLMRAGVVTHYLPLTQRGEKGIDVSLALEAYESALLERYDVLALIAGDGDYVPLVRKLAIVGVRVMLLGWDIKWLDENDNERETRTSQGLLDAATYPLLVSSLIDDRAQRGGVLIDNLFLRRATPLAVPVATNGEPPKPPPTLPSDMEARGRTAGTIKLLKSGYGFVVPDSGGADVFFHATDLVNRDYMDLHPGDRLTFVFGHNNVSICAQEIEVL